MAIRCSYPVLSHGQLCLSFSCSLLPPSSSENGRQSADTEGVRSGRQCSLGLPLMATLRDERLRRDAGMEERLRGRVTVWHLLQIKQVRQ